MHGANRLLSSDGGGKLTERNQGVNLIDLTDMTQTRFESTDRVKKMCLTVQHRLDRANGDRTKNGEHHDDRPHITSHSPRGCD